MAIQAGRSEAVDIFLALNGGHYTIDQVAQVSQPKAKDARALIERYRASIERANLSSVTFCDQFPILRAAYGYTRGKAESAMLQPFNRRSGYRLYADMGLTEALLVTLDPVKVIRWLAHRHPQVTVRQTAPEARVEILKVSASLPRRLDDPGAGVGEDLVALVHTYAHRLIGRTSAFAGIDRDAISEHLLPSHAAFFVYAQPRGNFVLGGLQALFETSIDALLDDFFDADPRCPLDPACAEHGEAACAACLYLGEPSCRWFNRRLSRKLLYGQHGYLTKP
jgi:hypothetical protein